MIESRSNPIVKSLIELSSSKARRERGLFLVEGVRAVEDGLSSGHVPTTCLYNTELLSHTERGRHLLERINGQTPRIRSYEASATVLEVVSETQHPQGIAAVFSIPVPPSAIATSGPALIPIADEIRDPGNLGTILRTSEAAGATAVLLSRGCVEPYNPKVVRAGMGTHFRLPVYANLGWEDIDRLVRGAGVQADAVFALDAASENPYHSADWRQSAAFVVANEAHGLTGEAREWATMRGGLLTIPMAGAAESLNAAVAAAVVLFEAARQRSGDPAE